MQTRLGWELASKIRRCSLGEPTDSEVVRFRDIKDAFIESDAFFLTLNQLACLESLRRRNRANSHMACSSASSVAMALGVACDMFSTNAGISDENLAWFSRFPEADLLPISGAVSPPSALPEDRDDSTVGAVFRFLNRFAEYWPRLLQQCGARHCPVLMDELVFVLNCPSPLLRNRLWRLSLKAVMPRSSDGTSTLSSDSTAVCTLGGIFCADADCYIRNITGQPRRKCDEQLLAAIEQFNHQRIEEYRQALQRAYQQMGPFIGKIDARVP